MKLEQESTILIFSFINGLLTMVIGVWGVVYTRKQHFLEQNKFKLEMYDRRFKVFEELNIFLSTIMSSGTINIEMLLKLKRQTNQTIFLFDNDINNYINMVYTKGVDFFGKQQQITGDKRLPSGEERSQISHECGELLHFFSDQFEESKERFSKYLKIN